MDREIFVYIDFHGSSILVGRLWARVRGKKESASFEFDDAWLARDDRFSFDPSMQLTSGTFHTGVDKALFGAIGDSAPDRWGRALMRRAERRRALEAKETPRSLFEADYLLMVNDFARQGALRFTTERTGPFLATGSALTIPPLVSLPKLLAASERVEVDSETSDELKLLLAPGSSLGGARPKASVLDTTGSLLIAKFPKQDDEIDIVKWEALALSLAAMVGIRVPDWRVHKLNRQSVLLVKRFDRDAIKPHIRIPFLSAMSMLGAHDHSTHSYLEIADALKMYGANPKQDLIELFSRIVLNICISNVDDHLRNHGFLYQDQDGWRLSPVYDLNPVPRDIQPKILSTNITEDDGTASTELALEVANQFGMSPRQAKWVIEQVQKVTAKWKKVAKDLGISSSQMDRMASAFE